MELLMSVVIGLLFTVGVYLILSRRLFRIILGTGLLSHGTLLLLMTVGKLKRGAPPILTEGIVQYVDPIPQALILTAIVIGFATTAFALVLAYRAYQELGSDDTEDLRGAVDEQ